MVYPKVTDDDFYNKIKIKYKKFKVAKTTKTYDQWCYPKQFTLLLPQQFLSNFINPNTPYKDILVYHRIGSGKTCAAIQIAEKWKRYKRILIVLPASLRGNFRNELRSKCAGDIYITEHDRTKLTTLDPLDDEYNEIIKKSNERIDKYYEIYSYNKFVELTETNELNLKNAVLIIDEIQNMISEHGTFYRVLYNTIKKAPLDLRIILLSATPMFDRPNELALTLNLLRLPKELPTGKDFDAMFIDTNKKSNSVKNMDIFKSYIKGFISYYLGAPSFVFPETKIHFVKCVMSDFQYKIYKEVSDYEETFKNELSNDFYIGTRMISNIVFPNGMLNEKGFAMLTSQVIKKNLEKYSCKFVAIIDKIKKTKGKIFVYSNFKEFGGLASFIKILETFGYKNYMRHGTGKRTFAVWTGDETDLQKNEIRTVYNHENNIYGKKIKILLGSSAIKEGVTLFNVRQTHIIEGYWNWTKIKQVIGRVSRLCSHKQLPEEERNVKIYLYLAVANNNKVITVDEYMKKLAQTKEKLIRQFENAIKESAIDCELNLNANTNDGIDPIVCDK